ncbi:hypothetical protein ACFO5Q_02035 [Kordiimonas lipolytica]|uniref:Uncharacterized protein n=2 Tax=Kordiimonas lipolytica TaxID=1662421 RepID=A0ABV8U698_9PROT
MGYAKLAFVSLVMGLSACAGHSNFKWDAENRQIKCGPNVVTPTALYLERKEDIVSYMAAEGTYDPTFKYHRPSAVGYKRENDQQLLRYDFDIPKDDAPLGFDGGSAVIIDACTKEPVSTALIGW